MVDSYKRLLAGNRRWVHEQFLHDPEFFAKLAEGQEPSYLWIGCSDSRVSANEITNTLPGEVFVHRNIANLVVHTDMNMLSVLQYAVEVLKVKHIIVCGHYGCGGIKAALSQQQYGLIDNWLRHIKDVYRFHLDEFENIADPVIKERRLVELNVIEQVYDLAKTSIVQNAWNRGEFPYVHGWVYDLHDGLIRDLEVSVRDAAYIQKIYHFEG